jgi:competence protein ComEA
VAGTTGDAGLPTGTPPAPAAGTATGVSGGTGVVVVDVAGKVRRPGIVTLPVGARVVDAVTAAGGPRPGVRTTGLNLARVLVDGEQVLVGVPPVAGPAAAAVGSPGPTSGTAAGPAALVNVNTADQATLETLPGVGPVTAQAILAYRSENGPFSSVDELVEVSGIGEATLAEIAPHVTL